MARPPAPDLADFEVYRSGDHFSMKHTPCGSSWAFAKTSLRAVIETAKTHTCLVRP